MKEAGQQDSHQEVVPRSASLEQEFNEEVLALFTKTGQATGYWLRQDSPQGEKSGIS